MRISTQQNAIWPPLSHERTVARAQELFESLADHNAELPPSFEDLAAEERWIQEQHELEMEHANAHGTFDDEYATQQERY